MNRKNKILKHYKLAEEYKKIPIFSNTDNSPILTNANKIISSFFSLIDDIDDAKKYIYDLVNINKCSFTHFSKTHNFIGTQLFPNFSANDQIELQSYISLCLSKRYITECNMSGHLYIE